MLDYNMHDAFQFYIMCNNKTCIKISTFMFSIEKYNVNE